MEDAVACGQVLLKAAEASNKTLEELVHRVTLPINLEKSVQNFKGKKGNPEGDFFGEVLVFTGTLTVPRVEAAKLAASVGFDVATSVTKKTTVVVVGDQDISCLAGHGKSSKHRKAEDLIKVGSRITICSESDFSRLIGHQTLY